MVNDFRPTRDSDPWDIGKFQGDNARFVLEAMQEVARRLQRAFHSPSREEASWVVRIHKAAPGLDPYAVWLVTCLYRARKRLVEHLGRAAPSAEPIDTYLAYHPWRDRLSFDNYRLAVEVGEIAPVPLWRTLVEARNPSLGPWQRAWLELTQHEEENDERLDPQQE